MNDKRDFEMFTELHGSLSDVVISACLDALDAGSMTPHEILENLTMCAVFQRVADVRDDGCPVPGGSAYTLMDRRSSF